MKSPTTLRFQLLTLLLATPAFAHEQGPQTGPPMNQQFPGANGLANFRKVVAGEFTGNLVLDAVIMDGNRPCLVKSPEYFDTRIELPSLANDIAVLSGVVAGKDLLVTVEAGGLKLYERNSGVGPNGGEWTTTVVRGAATAWANAAFVAVGDINGDGCPDIVGVAANKRDVLTLYGACGTTFTTGPTFVLPAQVVNQLMLANWRETGDTENTQEIVLCSSLGWCVIESNGAIVKAVSWTTSPVRAVAIRNQNGATDRIVTTAVFNGTDRLSISDVSSTEGPYDLGALGVVAMASADMTAPTADGDTDLVLTTNTDRKLRIYENQSSATTFNLASPTQIVFGPTTRNAALNQAGIAIGDYDSDGYPDVIAPAQGDTAPGPILTYGSIAIVRPYGAYGLYQCWPNDPRFMPSTGAGVPDRIRLRFDPPSPTGRLVAQAGSSQVVELRILVYRTPALGAEPILDPQILTIPVPPTNGFQYATFDLPSGYSLETSTEFFSVVAYQQVRDGEIVLDRAPATTSWVSPDSNMGIANNTKDTVAWFGVRNWPESIPGSGALEQGPIVPPADKDKEPKE